MIIITDSNVIFSALIRPEGTIAQIFKAKSKLQFLAPDFMLSEIKEHWNEIKKQAELSNTELTKEYEFLAERIKVINLNDIPKKKIFEAYEIVKDIDEEDTYFVALHLHTKHKIWTLDNKLVGGLEKKGYHICVTTQEIKQQLYKK
ncbi:MAG: PIN domain nuclease [Bacteroidetes bacterium]|nr:PIN domain nuclease [Bacteroidota bacterium]